MSKNSSNKHGKSLFELVREWGGGSQRDLPETHEMDLTQYLPLFRLVFTELESAMQTYDGGKKAKVLHNCDVYELQQYST